MKLEMEGVVQEELLKITEILKGNCEIATVRGIEADIFQDTKRDTIIRFKVIIDFPHISRDGGNFEKKEIKEMIRLMQSFRLKGSECFKSRSVGTATLPAFSFV